MPVITCDAVFRVKTTNTEPTRVLGTCAHNESFGRKIKIKCLAPCRVKFWIAFFPLTTRRVSQNHTVGRPTTLVQGSPSHTESKVIIQPDPDHSDVDKGVKKSISFAERGVSRRKENGKAVSNRL